MSPIVHRTILIIDLGTQSLRVSALRTDGERVWQWSAPVDSDVRGEVIEQSPRQWASLLQAGLQAAHAAGVRPDAVSAAGPLAGYVPLDAQGHTLGPAVMYSDRRSTADVEHVQAMPGDDAGTRHLVSDPCMHWLRLRRESPDVAARTAHFLDATGWINHVLTGEATLNPYTAMRLLPREMCANLGIADAPFGRRVAIGEQLGTVQESLGARWHWTGVPVIAATFDSKCAYIGSGISRPGEATDISGTVTSFGVVGATRVDDVHRRVYSVPLGEHWLVRGSTACAGSALEWARAQLLQQDFDALDAAAASVPPGANGLTFLPYLAGERAPLWDPHAQGALLGLGLHSTRADMARAVYEGLALSLGHIAQTIRACGGQIDDVRLAGGLSRNDVLSQIKADVLGVPMLQMADHELTTLGLAAIVSVALGLHLDHATASRSLTSIRRRFLPRPDGVRAYRSVLERYVLCSTALKPTFTPRAPV